MPGVADLAVRAVDTHAFWRVKAVQVLLDQVHDLIDPAPPVHEDPQACALRLGVECRPQGLLKRGLVGSLLGLLVEPTKCQG